jgi:hypothetical protein
VFDVTPARVINGYTHIPVSGGVSFNGTAVVLQSMVGTTLGSSLGTAYAIKYPFKDGYYYTISITASESSDDPVSNPRVELALYPQALDPNTTRPTGCGSVGQDHWGVIETNVFGGTYVGSTSTTYNLSAFNSSGGLNYLYVLASQGSATSVTFVSISKITITETPPTFTLSPAIVNKTCGTSLSQDFAIINVHNTPGVTSYGWDLGSASNGWLYNGSPAPQAITTATPSLTLTADGCSVLSNITATGYIGSTGYASNTATIVSGGVTSTLDGPSQICDVATYSITDLPCGATVSWSLSPATSGTLSATTGPSTTLTRQAQGHMTITANVVTTCGTFNFGRLVTTTGAPSDFGISADVPCQQGRIVQVSTFTAVPATTGAIYHWSWNGGTIPNTGPSFSKKFSPGSYTILAWAENACGETSEVEYPFSVVNCGGARIGEVSVQVSPNPASDMIIVSYSAMQAGGTTQESQDIREIRIIDKMGRLLRRQLYPPGTKSANINVQGIKPDIYILQTGNGKTFTFRQVTIFR